MPAIAVTERICIEEAPRRRRAVATRTLLDDKVTARHYQAGQRDRLGKVIAEGEPMDFFDHRSRARVHVVYLEETFVEKDKDGNDVVVKRLMPKSEHETQAEAVRAAAALAVAVARGEEPYKGDLRPSPEIEAAGEPGLEEES